MTKSANAYMLVYVRESEWDTVMCPVTQADISAHVQARLKVGGWVRARLLCGHACGAGEAGGRCRGTCIALQRYHCPEISPCLPAAPALLLLLSSLQAEQEEKERRAKEKAEAHLFTMVRISTDADIAEQVGTSRYFDLCDHDKVGGGWMGGWGAGERRGDGKWGRDKVGGG